MYYICTVKRHTRDRKMSQHTEIQTINTPNTMEKMMKFTFWAGVGAFAATLVMVALIVGAECEFPKVATFGIPTTTMVFIMSYLGINSKVNSL